VYSGRCRGRSPGFSTRANPELKDFRWNHRHLFSAQPGAFENSWNQTEKSGLAIQRALAEIDRLSTSGTLVILIEFIRKNLFSLAARGAFADKGLQMFMVFKSRAVLGCRHRVLLGVWRTATARPVAALPPIIDPTAEAWDLFYSWILATARTIGGITAVVHEFTFLFARRTCFRWRIGFEFISAVAAFPTCHGAHLLRRSQDFQCPWILQYSRAVIDAASTLKTASGA
jgi:hypothetical protein